MAVIPRANILKSVEGYATFVKAGAVSDGDFNGQAAPGDHARDTTNGNVYINAGTKAATVWKLVTRAA